MRIRRQESDKMNPDRRPIRVLKSRPARVAEMAQVDPASRAVQILGRRAAKDGVIRVRDIGGLLTDTRFEQADERSTLRWSKNEPDLPEKMVRVGRLRREELPPLFKVYLRD